jgi:hypothetical protein
MTPDERCKGPHSWRVERGPDGAYSVTRCKWCGVLQSVYPTVKELEPFIGRNWGVCRKTPRNLTKYDRCLTRKEFKAAQEAALKARP